MSEAQTLFQTVVDDHSTDPAVRQAKMFGAHCLQVNDKNFAMLYKGQLVVKLPRERVEALVATGEGKLFDPGHGRVMGGWAMIDPVSEEQWRQLAQEAKAYVREVVVSGKAKRKKKA